MNKLKKIVLYTGIGAACLAGSMKAGAQDFFNGFPSPKNALFNYFGSYSDGKISNVVIPAGFIGRYGWNGNMIKVAVPTEVNAKDGTLTISPKAIVIGHTYVGEDVGNTIATKFGLDGSITVQEDLTAIVGNTLIDYEAGVELKSGKSYGSIGLAHGLHKYLGMKKCNLWVGGYVGFDNEKSKTGEMASIETKPKAGLITSLEIKGEDEKPKIWFECYANYGKGMKPSYGLRVSKPFDINLRKHQRK